jgi:hypothetical protein
MSEKIKEIDSKLSFKLDPMVVNPSLSVNLCPLVANPFIPMIGIRGL